MNLLNNKNKKLFESKFNQSYWNISEVGFFSLETLSVVVFSLGLGSISFADLAHDRLDPSLNKDTSEYLVGLKEGPFQGKTAMEVEKDLEAAQKVMHGVFMMLHQSKTDPKAELLLNRWKALHRHFGGAKKGVQEVSPQTVVGAPVSSGATSASQGK